MSYNYETKRLRTVIKEKITSMTPREKIDGDSKEPHYFLLAGHWKGDSGAVANGYKENELTIEFRDLLYDNLRKFTSSISKDDDFKSLRDVVNWLHERTKEIDYIFDIHFNCSDNEKATGCEVFIPDSPTNKESSVAVMLSSLISDVLGIKNRGVKKESESSRGQLAIMSPLGTNILMEICFISNKSDMEAYQKNKQKLAEKLAFYIGNYKS